MIVRGVCPVIAATFDDDGGFDEESFRSLARYLFGADIDALMIFGVATENAKLRDSERERMLDIVLEERGNTDIPVVATVADHATELAVERARQWVRQGADMINLLPSRFLDPPTDQAVDHLTAVLGAVEVPVIVQFLPQAGAALDLDSIVDIHATHPNLVQVKIEEIPAAPGIELVRERSAGSVTSLVGWGGLEWREAVAAGAVGVQPGCSLIELYVHAQRALDVGDDAGFHEAFAPLAAPLRQWMRHVEVLIAVEKIILQRRGIIASSRCRRPSATLDTDDLAFIDPLLERVGDVR